MRSGVALQPVAPVDTYVEMVEEIESLGFDELWLGEHFSATTEPIPSPMMFFAGLLPQTKNITFGTAVINLPNHHPAIVAAEATRTLAFTARLIPR